MKNKWENFEKIFLLAIFLQDREYGKDSEK